MEGDGKDGTTKPLIVHPPTAKPQPVPRKRNQPKGDTSVQNGKPENRPPKPVILPKPRRPPPNAPIVKPPEPLKKNVTKDNEVLQKESTESKVASNREPLSGKGIDQSIETQNGPANVDLKDSEGDDQWYESLRPKQESQLSMCSSEEDYEDVPSPRASKVTPPSPRKRSVPTTDSDPAASSIHKINSPTSKISPPVLQKSGGIGIRTSPQLPCKSSEIRQAETVSLNASPRDPDSSSTTCNKSKPLPPKKPLPSLPKGLSRQNMVMETTTTSKPPVPQKPPPELAPASSASDTSQPSVAVLAQKLSTIPVFPFRDASTGKVGIFPSPGTSPRSSPLSSPRPTSHNPAANLLSEKPTRDITKPNVTAKPKLHPKPGSLPEKPQTQGHEVQKYPPARPSPPSQEAVVRTRSRTVESLEDKDGTCTTAQIETLAETAEFRKKKLATRVKTLQHGVARSTNVATQANRRPPPLPPGAVIVSEKPSAFNRPPLPAVPRPRPVSSFEHSQEGAARPHVSKCVSLGIIPKVSSAEEQAEYSYAYEHTFIGGSPPKRALTVRNPSTLPVEDSGDSYVTPDEHVVNEFMEDLHENKAAASYDVADQQAVAGFIDSIRKKKQTLNGLTCELSSDESESSDSDDHEYIVPSKGKHEEVDCDDDDSDGHEYVDPPVEETEDDDTEDHSDASSVSSFSSDSSHEYCVPPENMSPPEPPPHEKEYDEMESIYMEPIRDPSEDVFSSDDDKYNAAEEPLYQVYTRCTLQRERSMSRHRMSSDVSTSSDETFLEELAKGTLRNMRVLWCELPEVKTSGILDTISPDERKRQEAMFEVITSEASYLRSLNILMSHFINSDELSSGSSLCVLERGQSHVLFSNISAIKSVSENFLQALRARQKEAVVISSISDIIEEHARQFFEVYVKYCSNQIYQDRALKNLRKSVRFIEAVKRLQSGKEAQGLTLQSFLVLPMQRITRLPLLVNAICHRCEAGSEEFNKTDRALAAINKIVNDCNEGARKMERMEEICVLQTQIEFKTKPLALATPSRYLLRRGDILQIVEDSRSPLKKLRPKFKPIYMMLFNDLLLLTKKKSENRFQVLDYATRNMTQVEEPNDCDVNVDHMFSLVLLENSEGKTKEFLMAGNNETDKTRWMEAFKPPVAEQEGETVYASWDCPQVNALHNYTAQQPDELSLYEGDVINVLKKLPDGWYHGERLCDGTQGWFPANHTEEILNDHVRARNLRQRYRLLAASKHLIGGTLRL